MANSTKLVIDEFNLPLKLSQCEEHSDINNGNLNFLAAKSIFDGNIHNWEFHIYNGLTIQKEQKQSICLEN